MLTHSADDPLRAALLNLVTFVSAVFVVEREGDLDALRAALGVGHDGD